MIQLNIMNPNITFKYFKQAYAFIDSQNILHISGYYLNNYFSKQYQIDINNIPYSQIIVDSNTINISYIIYNALANNLSFTNTLPNFTTPNLITFELYTYQGIILSDTNLITAASTIQNISNTLNSLSSVLTNISETCISITNLYNSVTNLNNSLSSLLQSINASSSLAPIFLYYFSNVTSYPDLYSLSVNQSLIIVYKNSQTVFVPLQLTGNDVYKLYIVQPFSFYWQFIYLYPNNIPINNITITISVNNTNTGYAINSGSNNYFYLTSLYGELEATIINNSPSTKLMISQNYNNVIDNGQHFNRNLIAQVWDDTSTSWTMFGTIMLTSPNNGFVVITREV